MLQLLFIDMCPLSIALAAAKGDPDKPVPVTQTCSCKQAQNGCPALGEPLRQGLAHENQEDLKRVCSTCSQESELYDKKLAQELKGAMEQVRGGSGHVCLS